MTFAPVQGGFGLGVELLPRGSQLRTGRDAAREVNRPDFGGGGPLLYSFGIPQRAVCVGVRHEQCELVAPDAKRAVREADRLLNEHAYVAQPRVAGSVTLGVVDQLQVVEVNQQECKRHLVALKPLELPIKLLVKGAIVAQAGQPVARANLLGRRWSRSTQQTLD